MPLRPTIPLPGGAALMPARPTIPLPHGAALAVLAAVVLTLLISVGLIELPVLLHTQGRILFPLDGAFLNISVGRNLAFYQVWGISKHSFQSASSSLLYPLVLAPVFFIAGAHLLIPLIVNLLAAVFFLYRLQQTLLRRNLTPPQQLLILLAAMAFTLLPLLVVSGMEYVLQLLFVFLFIEALAAALKDDGPITRQQDHPITRQQDHPITREDDHPLTRRIYLYAALAVAARYEDVLIIGLACLFLDRQKALKLAAVSLAPILIFGVISILKKSYFLPNTLLLGPYPGYALGLATLTLFAIAISIPKFKRIELLLLLLLPFSVRNLQSLQHFRRDCDRMYDQQYLTARFVHLYYYRSAVGVDEPGAISWFSEGRKLDFTGVANRDVIRSKRMHYWSPVYADSLSRLDGIRAAIVADPWFNAHRVPKWDRVASWNIPDSGPAPGPSKTVTFYAVDEWDTTNLRRNLHAYEHLLPAGVAVRYY